MADLPRSPSDVEKAITDIIGDLRGKSIDGTSAKQIRDAADTRVKQVESDRTFHRAISSRP
jgi:hypothetical protein